MANGNPRAQQIDLEALRASAVEGGGPFGIFVPEETVIALCDLVDAARAVSYTVMPALPKKPVGEWYRCMDRLLKLTERFTNFGDVPK